jgi:protein-disulfide isomerase
VSRGYNARRKAKRQEARASAEPSRPVRRDWPRRWLALVPVVAIVAILAIVAALGFGSSNSASKEQVKQEVTELLDEVPQSGTALGSPQAPVTLWVYGDLECPTVKLFVENYLPSLIEGWVRTGAVQLEYRSLETDTSDEAVFFKQEIAALAAGRQDKLWNYVLTFVREQGEPRTNYVTDAFIGDIASQVPGLDTAKWRRDRTDALLSKRVALGVYSGHSGGLSSTPSFQVGFTEGKVDRRAGRASIKEELEATLGSELEALQKESNEDFPTLKTIGPGLVGG